MPAELNACMRKTPGCMYADFGYMSMERLGACMRMLGARYAVVGCMYAETLGCKYAVVGCESMERLGACLTVFACLTVGSLPDSR